MGKENEITKRMLSKLRENRYIKEEEASKSFVVEEKEYDNFLTRAKVLMEESVNDKKKPLTEGDDSHSDYFEINKSTPQFGDVCLSQEETIKKTVGENVTFSSGALRYYPKADDMTINGKVNSLNLSFQFRYADSSGDGCYIWCDGLTLNDSNLRTVGKIHDAFVNWKNTITNDGDLMEKLKRAASQDN